MSRMWSPAVQPTSTPSAAACALFADGKALQSFQVFRPEQSRRRAVDAATRERDAAGEETHDATSSTRGKYRLGETLLYIGRRGVRHLGKLVRDVSTSSWLGNSYSRITILPKWALLSKCR